LITALLESVTLPVTYPEVVDCARIAGTHARIKAATMAGHACRVKRIFSSPDLYSFREYRPQNKQAHQPVDPLAVGVWCFAPLAAS
jgi:hypothetical protein